MPARKVIITCAVTGSAHTPTMSPNLPYTVEDVVDQSVAAVEAGAAIIHLHARDPRDGHALSSKASSRSRAPGPGSHATTSYPRRRKCAAHPPPMTPVPTTATVRTASGAGRVTSRPGRGP